MALDNTPWFIGGGAQHSPEVARTLAFASTRGAEGIVGIGDLKVQAQAVANGTVRVSTGAAIILNRYAGGGQQSYGLRNATQTDVAITATGSGAGRTDLIIARVLDPQYEGAAPADPVTFQYSRIVVVQGVPAGTKTAAELNLGYPAIALAKVTLPVSTATITAGMITDLRKVANPRRDRAMVTVFPSATQSIPTAGYSSWPIQTAQRPLVPVPSWATRVDIVAHLSGVKFVQSGGAATTAGIRTGFGSSLPAQNGIIVQDAVDTSGRYHYTLVGTHIVDASMRGTDQYINLQGVRTAGSGLWTADYQTSIVIDWEFSEGAQ
ncbi:minor tail protein [Arthrobacter phage Aoka]|nr:minor tail protein [Arthrobacter phage Aoka]